MTLEAAAGKNPVSHVGKIYNLLANEIAHSIWSSVDAVGEVYVWMCSQIGEPLDHPWQTSVQVALASGVGVSYVEPKIRELVEAHIANMPDFTARLSHGELPVC